MSHGIHQYGGGLMPPSFHVGCLPVRTSDGAAPEDIAQPLVLNWKFDTLKFNMDLTSTIRTVK